MFRTEKELQAIKKMKQELREQLWHLEFLENGGVIGRECDLYTENIEIFRQVVEHYKTNREEFWGQQNNWSLENVFPERYKNQKKFVEQAFYSYLAPDQYVCDLASANGEWSFDIAGKVKCVEGFEYAGGMVDTATAEAQRRGIDNVSFQQADALTVEFPRQYDNFMMMGLLTCIQDNEDAKKILAKVYGAMKDGARLVVKDSVNLEGQDIMFMYNYRTNYQGTYRMEEKYMELYQDAGFTLEQSTMLHQVDNSGLKFGSVGAVWIKND